MQHLRLDAAARGGIAAFEFERVGLGQHAVFRKHPAVGGEDALLFFRERDSLPLGHGGPAFRGRVIGPARGVDDVGQHAGRGRLLRRAGEEARRAELAREVGFLARVGIAPEAEEAAGRVVHDEQFVVRRDAEARGHQRAVAQFARFGDAIALRAQRPERPHLVVAVNVGACEFRQFFPVIKFTARDARGLFVRMRDQRRQDGCRPAQAVRAHVLFAAFGDAPAVIAAALDAIDHLPQFPADIARVEFAGLRIEAQPPRIAQSVGPHFAARVGRGDKRIVLGNAIRQARLGTVHVDAEHARQALAEILPANEAVGRVRRTAVARADVEHAVRAEAEVAAVMSPGEPTENHLAARDVHLRRIRFVDTEPHDAGAILAVLFPMQLAHEEHEDEAVLRKFRVKREGVGTAHLGVELFEIRERLGLLDALRRAEGERFALLLEQHDSVRAGQRGGLDGLGEREVRKRALDAEGQRRLGRALDARGRPRHARLGGCEGGREHQQGEDQPGGERFENHG